jgi:ribonucleoside-diphosphate reductase alpha chain
LGLRTPEILMLDIVTNIDRESVSDARRSSNARASCIQVERVFSCTRTEYEQREVVVNFATNERVECRVPNAWSDNAAATLMSKYAVRAGVPDDLGGVNGREVDAERIFDRLVLGWRQAAVAHGYWLASDPNLDAFCEEIKAMLEQQRAAPNSPQWFNTGVQAAYGITAGSDGHYYATVDSRGGATAHACSDSLAHPQISACFIQSVDDKLVGEGGIMNLWEREARLFKYGSGSGANYSALRGKGEKLSRGGASSGLLSFLRVGDRSAGAVKSGGTTRRSARMVIVDADHPDIEDFIGWKTREDKKIRVLHAAGIGDPKSYEDEATDTVSGQNANNSVSVSDDFMDAVVHDREWELINRTDGRVAKTVRARDLWQSIATAAWSCADPGLQFAGTINAWHTSKADGDIHGANPCAEYVFLDDTACNLASINLAKFYAPERVGERGFDWDGFGHAVRLWTIVLDISVSMAGYPTAEIARRSMLYRTLGLGYAALGELLVLQDLGYGTEGGRERAAELTSLMTAIAYLTSTELAEKLGAFPRFDANREHVLEVLGRHRAAAAKDVRNLVGLWSLVIERAEKFGVRNAQVTLLAPCGTIGIVLGCDTTGVEPYYNDTTFKKLAGGGSMKLVARGFAEKLAAHGYNPEDFTRTAWTVEDGDVREYVWCEPPAELAHVLVCADDLTPQQHVAMMAAVQPFLSGAISKTVSCPSTVTVDDIAEMHMLAWRSGLKSVAVYRDGCKPAQPLQGRKPKPGVQTYSSREAAERAAFFVATVDEAQTAALARGERVTPPKSSGGHHETVDLGGHKFYLMLTEHEDGTLAAVFVVASRTGSTTSGWLQAWAKTFSLALQHGTPLDVLVSAMRGEMFEPTGFHDGHPMLSPIDAFARIIEARYLTKTNEPVASHAGLAAFRQGVDLLVESKPIKSTGNLCDNCGSPNLTPSGTCYVCKACGSTTGCS